MLRRYIQDPMIAGVLLCILLSCIITASFFLRAPGMGSDIWRSGDISLSPDKKQIARENFTTILRLEEGDVIRIDYEPEFISCTIENNGMTSIESGESFTAEEGGSYILTFEAQRDVKLHYDIHKEGFRRGSLYFFILPIIPAVLLFSFWFYIADRSDYEEKRSVTGEEEAFAWRGAFGQNDRKVLASEPRETNLDYLVPPSITVPASLLTFYFWQDIHSVFLLLGPSRLSFCCGWALLPSATAFFGGMVISSSGKLLSSESTAGLTGGVIGSILAAVAHIFVVYYGSYLLLAGLYGTFAIFYLTAVLEYQITT